MIYDVIIIGGGPAGLTAGVVLGRCQLNVLLFDHGKQRNITSHGMHNYLTCDGIAPADFLEKSRSEAKKYGVQLSAVEVISAVKQKDIFIVRDINQKVYHTKKLVLATGLRDILPDIEGIGEFYGYSVHHCPYCDGWEVKNKALAVYSKTTAGVELAMTLRTWSNNISLFTNGVLLRKNHKDVLRASNINLIPHPISKVEGNNKMIRSVLLKNGQKIPCEALFFSNGYEVQCNIVKSLGCTVGKNNVAFTNKTQETNIPGLYVVGDASKDMHFVVVAAAEGAKAGVYIHKVLMSER